MSFTSPARTTQSGKRRTKVDCRICHSYPRLASPCSRARPFILYTRPRGEYKHQSTKLVPWTAVVDADLNAMSRPRSRNNTLINVDAALSRPNCSPALRHRTAKDGQGHGNTPPSGQMGPGELYRDGIITRFEETLIQQLRPIPRSLGYLITVSSSMFTIKNVFGLAALLSLARLAAGQAAEWGQCGGIGWMGATTCGESLSRLKLCSVHI